MESWGFIKRINTYPAVYQVTKSVTRLMGADLSARRQHAIETIRTRLLTVNFYLEAIRWPVEFVFDHERKISKFRALCCEPDLLPQRGSKPYLWQDIVLERPSGDLAVAMVDHFGRSPRLQLNNLVRRFAPSLGLIQDELNLLVVVGSDARHRLFGRLLRHPRLQRLRPDMPKGLEGSVKLYRVRRAVPVVRSLVYKSRDMRELRALRVAGNRESGSLASSKPYIHSNAHDANENWIEEGGTLC